LTYLTAKKHRPTAKMYRVSNYFFLVRTHLKLLNSCTVLSYVYLVLYGVREVVE